MIPSDNLLEVYGDRGRSTPRATPAPTASVPRRRLVPLGRAAQRPRPEQRDGWWYFDVDQVRAAQREFPSYFAHWVDCVQNDRRRSAPARRAGQPGDHPRRLPVLRRALRGAALPNVVRSEMTDAAAAPAERPVGCSAGPSAPSRSGSTPRHQRRHRRRPARARWLRGARRQPAGRRAGLRRPRLGRRADLLQPPQAPRAR